MSAAHSDAVDRAVAALRYGSININVVTILGFCVSKLTWGAYPGNTPQVRTLPAGVVAFHRVTTGRTLTWQRACHISIPWSVVSQVGQDVYEVCTGVQEGSQISAQGCS